MRIRVPDDAGDIGEGEADVVDDIRSPDDAAHTTSEAGDTADATDTSALTRAPVVLVHGYLDRGLDRNEMVDGLIARGWARDRIFAFDTWSGVELIGIIRDARA